MPLYYAGKKIRDRGTNSGLFYAGNVIKKGSVVGGYDKHFSIPNKITLDDSGLSPENECWRIAIKFTIPDVTSDQRLFGSVATGYSSGVVIGIANGKLRYWISSGNGWDIADDTRGTYTLVAGSTYIIHFKRYNVNGVPFYQCSISPDGGAWTTDININNTAPIKQNTNYMSLGRDWSIFANNIVYHLDYDTYITKWNPDGTETRLWSATSEGVVPVQGISKVYLPCFIKMYNKPSFNKNIGSGFTDKDFFTVGEAWNGLNTANNWEMVFKVRTGDDVVSQQYIMVGNGTNARDVVVALVNKSWLIQMSSNGTSYDICDTTWLDGEILPNTTYWLKIQYNIRANYYQCLISYDGINFSRNLNIGVADNRKVVANGSHDLGAVIGATNWYWRGSIDFSGCYTNINGGRAWDYTSTRFKTLVYDFQKT